MLITAFFRDPLPESSTAMLEESSTTTATIFCCGRSVATLSAGCHSINSSRDASAVCNSHTATLLAPWTRAAPAGFRSSIQPKNPAAARMQAISPHTGHPPANTKVPREKTCDGYLNSSSNIVNSVCQIVHEIIHRDAVGQRGPLFRIPRIVRPLPGVAQVHIVADHHHQP